MKILFAPYHTFNQNEAGGVATKTTTLFKELTNKGITVDYFNSNITKLQNYDLIHFFKLHTDHYSLIQHARDYGIATCLSSISPLNYKLRAKLNLFIEKILPIKTIYGISKSIYDCSDAIITESQRESNYIANSFSIERKKIHEIPVGIDDKSISSSENLFRKTFNIYSPYVLMVGRVDSNKNQLNVIKACNQLGLQLVIVGGASSSSIEYWNLCKQTAQNNILFTDWIPYGSELLNSAFNSASLFVLSSFSETFGIVAFEALSYNCKVILSENLPVREWVDDLVGVFNPKSVKSIVKSLQDNFHSTTVNMNFKSVNEKYSYSNIADSHISVYSNILNKN